MLDIVCTGKFRPVTCFLFIVDKLHISTKKIPYNAKIAEERTPGFLAYCKEAIIVASSDQTL